LRRGSATTYLWLFVQTQVANVDLQIERALHHHAALQVVFLHLLLKAVLREAVVVEVIADTSIADCVPALVQIVGDLAVGLDEVKGGSTTRGLDVGGRTVVQQQLDDGLVAVGHGPHEGRPAILILDVDGRAFLDQRRRHVLVPKAARVDQRRRALCVDAVDVDVLLGLAVQQALDPLELAIGGGQGEEALQRLLLLVVGELLVGHDLGLVAGVVVLEARLVGEHLHEAAVAVLELLHVLVAKRGVVQREVEAEGPRGHGRGEEGAAALPGVVDLRLIVHDVDGAPVVEGCGQVGGELSWPGQIPTGEGMLGVGRLHDVTLGVRCARCSRDGRRSGGFSVLVVAQAVVACNINLAYMCLARSRDPRSLGRGGGSGAEAAT
jgi:hypothetical protein